ncbi:MAG: copper homeostasis protein CutC [Prevotella sp.]|nr:copper homeostasis protein CutC [Prevotella sp.]
MKRLLEVCTGNLASVIAAVKGGAERIELCSALSLDGLTPSIGQLKYVRQTFPELKIHVLIRSCEGGFVYSKDDLETMLLDIHEASAYADGIVCGALTPEGDIDTEALRLMVEASEGKPFTFHRAFDKCRNPQEALEQIIDAGCKRILTSGQQPSAEQGISLLHELNKQANGRIIIMPGGGVNEKNARLILDQTGCIEIHGSCSSGSGVTSAERVSQVKAIIGG